MSLPRLLAAVSCALGALVNFSTTISAGESAKWHYREPVERTDRSGKTSEGGVYLWIPEQSKQLRGLFICGRLGIEGELIVDPNVRNACAESDIGIVYFDPHVSGTFIYWKNPDEPRRWLKALDDLAARSGRPEVRRVPWITAGHSTAGIFCRNVGAWQPQRTAAVVHIKSGNFHQKDVAPPDSYAGIPFIVINGQFETFGPASGIRPEFGRQTQWVFAQRDIQKFRQDNPDYLMAMLVHHGDDHFHGAPELGEYVALFLRKTAQHRLPRELPPGTEPVKVLPLKATDGWLADPNLNEPKLAPAAYGTYAGDKSQAMWHYDEEIATANARWHKNLAKHQMLDNPKHTWLDEGDGWTFKVEAAFLDSMPEKHGGTALGGQPIGHSAKPFVFRCKPTEPVEQVGPDRFHVLRQTKAVNIAAYHAGDEQYRPTVRWSGVSLPAVKGKPQTIELADVPDLKPGATHELAGKASSGLPVYYEVDYGPVVLKGGKLIVADLPAGAKFPMPCQVQAYQLGRRVEPTVQAATPVKVKFNVVAP